MANGFFQYIFMDMNHTPQKIWSVVLLIALLVGGGWAAVHFHLFSSPPCSVPLSYSLGTVDSRFNVTQADFLSAVEEAEQVWEKPVNRNLFQYVGTGGKLKVNLIYDYRQEATDKLKSLGYNIETTQSSYNNLKSRYDSLVASYNSQKSQLDALIAQFDQERKAYEQQVNYYNQQGGAPRQQAAALNAEYNKLRAEAAQIKQLQDSVNALVPQINGLASILNSLASQLNLNVSSYNTIGESRGEEFEEGLYISDRSGQSVNIYEFMNHEQLVRVLAHELGHALGLEHVDDPNAIMYRLNESKNGEATVADLTELKQVCNMQ